MERRASADYNVGNVKRVSGPPLGPEAKQIRKAYYFQFVMMMKWRAGQDETANTYIIEVAY